MYNYVQPIIVAILAALTGQDTYTANKSSCRRIGICGSLYCDKK